jgi:hypothetical protein
LLWNVDVRFAQKVLWQVCKLPDNIREHFRASRDMSGLRPVEQASASSGSLNEEPTSERIAQQQEELKKPVKGRDAILKNSAEARPRA